VGLFGLIIHKTAAPWSRQNQSITVDYEESVKFEIFKGPRAGKGKRDKQVQGEHVSLKARLATRSIRQLPQSSACTASRRNSGRVLERGSPEVLGKKRPEGEPLEHLWLQLPSQVSRGEEEGWAVD